MLRLLAAPLALIVASPTLSQSGPAQEPAQANQSVPVKEKQICRSEPVLGSIMTKRTCHTQAEWEQISQNSQASLAHMREEQRGLGSARQ